MAAEIWLRTNDRAMWFGMIPPATIALAGGLLAVVVPARESLVWVRVAGGVVAAIAALLVLALFVQLRRPRLAYREGRLLVALRAGAPIEVPIECVECFWLGQAPSLLPLKRHANSEAASLVVRIADSATEWRHQDVKPQLGSWCEGYITIRGTWCERLSIELVNRLNQRLAELTRAPAGKSTHPS